MKENRYFKWHSYNVDLLKAMFDTNDVSSIYPHFHYGYAEGSLPFQLVCEHLRKDITRRLRPLESIVERLEFYEEAVPEPASQPHAAPESRKVFIIHGHDRESALELRQMLKEKFHLEWIVLQDQPGRSRTLIEKFEQTAPKCAFAFALFTPDDFVQGDSKDYFQMRPNVALELGWFYGRLGRERTCILLRKDTTLPSDLAGVDTPFFQTTVKEVLHAIEQELIAAGLVPETPCEV